MSTNIVIHNNDGTDTQYTDISSYRFYEDEMIIEDKPCEVSRAGYERLENPKILKTTHHIFKGTISGYDVVNSELKRYL